MQITILKDQNLGNTSLQGELEDLGHLVSTLVFSIGEAINLPHNTELVILESEFDFDFKEPDSLFSTIKSWDVPFFIVSGNSDSDTILQISPYFPEAYLVKPYNPKVIDTTIKILERKLEQKNKLPDFIKVIKERNNIEIRLDEIIVLEAHSTSLKVRTENKGDFTLKKSLSQMCEEFSDKFIQIHRSFAVNRSHIDQYTYKSVKTRLGELPVGRKFRNNII